jgi:hypothetical protein
MSAGGLGDADGSPVDSDPDGVGLGLGVGDGSGLGDEIADAAGPSEAVDGFGPDPGAEAVPAAGFADAGAAGWTELGLAAGAALPADQWAATRAADSVVPYTAISSSVPTKNSLAPFQDAIRSGLVVEVATPVRAALATWLPLMYSRWVDPS